MTEHTPGAGPSSGPSPGAGLSSGPAGSQAILAQALTDPEFAKTLRAALFPDGVLAATSPRNGQGDGPVPPGGDEEDEEEEQDEEEEAQDFSEGEIDLSSEDQLAQSLLDTQDKLKEAKAKLAKMESRQKLTDRTLAALADKVNSQAPAAKSVPGPDKWTDNCTKSRRRASAFCDDLEAHCQRFNLDIASVFPAFLSGAARDAWLPSIRAAHFAQTRTAPTWPYLRLSFLEYTGDDLRDDQTDARKQLLEGHIRMSSQLLLHDYITAYRNNLLTAGVQCMEESLLVSLFIKGLTPELKKAVLRDSAPFPAFTLAQAIDSARQAQRSAEILAEAVGSKRHVAAVQAKQLVDGLDRASNPRPPRSTQSDPPAKTQSFRARGSRAGMAAGPAVAYRIIMKKKAEEAAEQSDMKPGQYCHHCYDPRHLKPLAAAHQQFLLHVPDLVHAYDVLLGADWLTVQGALVDYVDKTLTLRTPQANPKALVTAKQAARWLRKGGSAMVAMVSLEDLALPVDAVSHAQRQHLQELLDEYSDVFQPITGLPPERAVGHSIPLQPDGKPPARPSYRMSKPEQDELRKQITDLLAKGLIEPSSSPYAAPVLFVQKKSGELRMCIDYRQLNKITIRDQYPLPRIDDLFDQLAGKTVFSSLDLQAGYHQIRIPAEDVPKTAFRTPMGHYQFKVLCFGLTNAPATFQRVMNEAFAEVINDCALVYLDDILVMSKDSEEHLVHLRRVFDLLRKNKLYAKLSKCVFMQRTLKFLGHIISAQGISVDPCKVTAISEWPVPTSLKTLQSFLGAANYVRKFVHNFSTIAAPLTNLTGPKKESFPWKAWPQAELDAFNALKQAISNVPLLKLPDHSKPFQVHCDASLEGIGAVLMQDGYPLAYYSRKLIPAEINYTTGEQELLALVSACQQWRCYLEGVPFTLTMNLRNMVGKARKLLPRYVGPFRIEAHVGRDAVKLTLPQAMSRIYPVFHVSLLRPYEGNFGRLPPTELGWLDDSPQYEVERIVNHRHVRARKAKEYLVKWKGYDDSDNTWEPASNLANAPDCLDPQVWGMGTTTFLDFSVKHARVRLHQLQRVSADPSYPPGGGLWPALWGVRPPRAAGEPEVAAVADGALRELELKWEASVQQVAGQGAAGEREQQGRDVEERLPEEVQGSQPPRWLDTSARAHQRPSPQMRAAQQAERQLEAQQRRGGRQPVAQPAPRADTVDHLAVGVQAGQPCAKVWKELLDPTLRREHVIVAWRVLHASLMVGAFREWVLDVYGRLTGTRPPSGDAMLLLCGRPTCGEAPPFQPHDSLLWLRLRVAYLGAVWRLRSSRAATALQPQQVARRVVEEVISTLTTAVKRDWHRVGRDIRVGLCGAVPSTWFKGKDPELDAAHFDQLWPEASGGWFAKQPKRERRGGQEGAEGRVGAGGVEEERAAGRPRHGEGRAQGGGELVVRLSLQWPVPFPVEPA
ncbi:hypothetical protein QJQ45_003152 [Haematococcus lacustris]|nr:hypothetical protein QJQ45_003152 [Haematococcus lacustris]